MRTGSLLFLSGILILTQLRELPPPALPLLLPFCLILPWKFPWLRWPAFFLAGFLWAQLHAQWVARGRLDTGLEGKIVVIEGTVVGLPELRPDATRFDFIIDKLTDNRGRPGPAPGKVRLSWYGRHPRPQSGEVWRFRVRLKRPHGFMNPGGFDYEGWLFRQGINATGYILTMRGAGMRLSVPAAISPRRLRSQLRRRLRASLGRSPSAALGMALAMGDRSALSTAQWLVLRRTGTSHLLAISGLHIGIIAGIAYMLARSLWSLTGVLLLGSSAPRAAAVVSLCSALAYGALSGFAIPTLRALIMIGVVLFMFCFSRRSSMSRNLALALFLVLCIDPFAVLSAGFWLSFSAVTVILYAMGHRVATVGKLWWRWGRLQVCVGLGLLPVLAYLFQQVPLAGVFANCVAVPWVSLVSLPLILCGTALTFVCDSAAQVALDMGRHSLDILWLFLETLSRFDFILMRLPAPSWAQITTAIAGVLILMVPAGVAGRWIGLFWLFPLVMAQGNHPPPGHFRLTLLDVGQGLAVMVQTRNHVLVYDTGPRYSDSFNAGDGILLPALRHDAWHRIDMLIVSHGDKDHIGGLAALMNAIPVNHLLSSVPEQVKYPGSRRCTNGQHWVWDGVLMEILHPPPGGDFTGNDASCVLQIHGRDHSVLITGDIEKAAEYDLVSRQKDKLHAEVLVVPHHGSMTSSTSEFIDAVHPAVALFAVGYRNRFGFPKQAIISRYRKRGIRTLETDRSGALEIKSTAAGLEISRYRELHRRFWNMAD